MLETLFIISLILINTTIQYKPILTKNYLIEENKKEMKNANFNIISLFNVRSSLIFARLVKERKLHKYISNKETTFISMYGCDYFFQSFAAKRSVKIIEL